MANYRTRSSKLDFILQLKIDVGDVTVITADGREVYRGKDDGASVRWSKYFRDRTPWVEIEKKEWPTSSTRKS